MCYICENHLIYCLTEKNEETLLSCTNERTKDVISAHHGISRRMLKAKFFLFHHSFAAPCHAVSNDFIPSVIYKGAYHNNNNIFTFQILSTLFNCFSTEKA